MKKYKWHGLKNGNPVNGEISCLNKNSALVKLRQQGIAPKKISRLFLSGEILSTISHQEITILTKEIATLLSSGIPIIEALKIIQNNEKTKSCKQLIEKITEKIISGETLFHTFSQFPKYFDTTYCQLIKTAEKSGQLICILEKIAQRRIQHEKLKRKIRKALIYPIITIITILVVTAILLLYVIPQFKDLFFSFNSELPWLTQIIISLSEQADKYITKLFIGIFLVTITTILLWRKNLNARIFLEKISLKIPITGNILEKSMVSTYCYTLSICCNAGVPLLDALSSMEQLFEYNTFNKVIYSIKKNIETGKTLFNSMQETKFFSVKTNQLIFIGESSGSLGKTLEQIFLDYESELNADIEMLTALIEPTIILFLSGIVGLLVTAMYLPIFQLGSAL